MLSFNLHFFVDAETEDIREDNKDSLFVDSSALDEDNNDNTKFLDSSVLDDDDDIIFADDYEYEDEYDEEFINIYTLF